MGRDHYTKVTGGSGVWSWCVSSCCGIFDCRLILAQVDRPPIDPEIGSSENKASSILIVESFGKI